jgi:dihydroorotate dehydrogenase electron transfer subunit
MVAANQPLCREHYRLLLHLDDLAPSWPGQFIQIACRDMNREDWLESELEWAAGRPVHPAGRELIAPLALLRRPFSLAGRTDGPDGVKLEVIHRVIGVGTEWMGRLRPGEAVQILGPLGNRFHLPRSGQPAILVGGGVGIPPMLYLAQALAEAGCQAVAFCGVTTHDLLPLSLIGAPHPAQPAMCVREFAACGIPTLISTDDGTLGFGGLVTQALEAHLDRTAGQRPLIYTCGPEAMMKRVAEMAMARGLDCQVAVERAMACGMGTCQSCVIRVRDNAASGGRAWRYRLTCTDGPVFWAADLLW